jgi:hypothetical protein
MALFTGTPFMRRLLGRSDPSRKSAQRGYWHRLTEDRRAASLSLGTGWPSQLGCRVTPGDACHLSVELASRGLHGWDRR